MRFVAHIVVVTTFLASILALSGCGMFSMPDKLDESNRNVAETNNKMTTTNEGIIYTNEQIKKTNEEILAMKIELEAMRGVMESMHGSLQEMLGALGEMQKLLRQMQQSMEAMRQSTTDMTSKMDQTNQKIDETNQKMASLKAAIHKQTLAAAMTELLKPENTQFLFPPTSLMAAGQIFAEEATSEEVTELVYVYLKDIDEVQPDDSLKGADGKFPASVIAETDHSKQAKFTILEVIAGLMPQEKVEGAVTSQINGGGRYEAAARSLLMLRTLFIKSILVEEDLFSGKLDNLGKIDEAVDRVSDLDWIARLPFVETISVKTRGMLSPDDNVNEKVDPKMTVSMWDHIAMSLDTEIDLKMIGDTPQNRAKMDHLKRVVQKYRDFWKSKGGSPSGLPPTLFMDFSSSYFWM